MDISKQFSFTDFLAYLFPGIMSVFGIYILLILTPVSVILAKISLDITTGILFLVASYVLGVIFSGFSSDLVGLIERLQRYKDIRKTIPINNFQEDILKAFEDIFGKIPDADNTWTRTHYYLCRALVSERMPAISLRADRQSNFALFRRNLLLPIFLWLITGVSWGITFIGQGRPLWGVLLTAITIAGWFFAVKTTVKRLHDGESRETREVLLGFLAGYKAKMFTVENK